MAGADGIDVPGQGTEEGRAVEVRGGLQQTGFILGRTGHLGQACQRLGHAPYLAGDVHVPHLVAVARTGAALRLGAVAIDIRTVVQAVPHPQPHVAGYEQGFVGHGLVIDIGGNVNQPGQLLVYGIIGCPHPTVVVIGTIHLYEDAVLGGDGIQIAVSILPAVLLVAVEIGPGALHLPELLLGCEVAGFPVAPQLVVPHEGAFLALAQGVDHFGYTALDDGLLGRVLTAGKGEGHS